MKVCLIPIYQSYLSEQETFSLRRTLSVLRKHDFVFVSPIGLDFDYYAEICQEYEIRYKIEYFEKKYFVGVEGYNRLMLSLTFYERFLSFDYILICQLDVYLFRDEYDYWISLNYDYIGAPCCFSPVWNWDNSITGNGGFSMRNPRKCLQILQKKSPLLSFSSLGRVYLTTPLLKKLLLMILGVFGYQNNSNYFINYFMCNEDLFWSLVGQNKSNDFSIPPKEISVKFCFERSPSELYARNGHELPWATHAYLKYEFDTFWKKWIH